MPSLTTRKIPVAGHDISLSLPTDPELLLADAADTGNNADPYWGILWDAAMDTAGCVLQSKWKAGERALEIGCGAGLVGIAGLLAGLNVTFSDHVPEAIELAGHNAAENGFPNAATKVINWRTDAPDPVDVLLASDILYEIDEHESILKFAEATLHSGGQFWIGDPGRQQSARFLKLATELGWDIELRNRDLHIVRASTIGVFQLITLSQ